MKKTGKIFVAMSFLSILLNNVAYAASEATGEKTISFSGKTFLIGIAVLVIVLLLYIGYKMDSNDEGGISKISSKKEKQREKLLKKAEDLEQNLGVYEADENVTYEADTTNFSASDFNENIEYDEDEDSLFDISTKEEDAPILDENFEKVSDNSLDESEEKPVETPETESEKVGEEFDVSVIDDLDDEDKEDSSKTSESTMLFDSSELAKASSGKDLEEEIDNLDDDLENIDEEVVNALENESKKDTFIDELKNFKGPEETDFVGFSVAKPIKKEDVIEEEKEEVESAPASTDNEFLSQMEANLEKSKEERNAKKSKTTSSAKNSTSKSKAYTKKTTTKKK